MRHEAHKFWRYLSAEKTSVPERKSPNATVDDPVTIAGKLNSFFQSAFTRSCSQVSLQPEVVDTPIPEINISEEGVRSISRQID